MRPTISRQFQQIGEDYQTLCRLCLKKTSLKVDMYHEDGLRRDISRKILNCLSLIVTKDDHLPKFVCVTCTDKLDNFQDFRDMCHESENLLTRYISEVGESHRSKQHDEDLSASPSSPSMEAGSKGNIECGESHSFPSHLPTPDFVSCSIKTEPQDFESTLPREERLNIASESNPSTILHSEPVEEHMRIDRQGILGDSSSEQYLQIDAGTSAFEEKGHVDASDDGAFEDSGGGDVEIVPGQLIKSELKIENEGPATEEERYLLKIHGMESGINEGYVDIDNQLHREHSSGIKNLLHECNPQEITCTPQISEEFAVHGHRMIDCESTSKFNSNAEELSSPVPHRKSLYCNKCKRTFYREHDFVNHMRFHASERSFLCSTCNKTFTRRNALKSHLRVHTKPEVFVCPTCNKSFSKKGILKGHSLIHSGEKPFVCPICNKPFTKKSQLNEHTIIHTGQKPFVCSICNRSFRTKSQHNKHTIIHTGEKPFVCETCNKVFARKSELKDHTWIHTGEKSFVCATCNKAFIRKDYLRKHSRVHRT